MASTGTMASTRRQRVVLLACGSFNPITNMHLRMFEVARDALHQTGKYTVIAGIISPVSDNYPKKDLMSAKHRCAMVQLAVKSSDWIRLDSWESEQNQWLETAYVLRHHKEALETTFGRNDDDFILATKKRKIETSNKNQQGMVSVNNANNDSGPIELKLLCGADVLESFAKPGVWKPEHMEEIVSQFGMVVCNRVGFDLAKFIYEFDLLTDFKNNITLVTDWITNEISSTKIRRALKRGESVKYLLQDSVIEYIQQNKLYGALEDNKLTSYRRSTSSPADLDSPPPPALPPIRPSASHGSCSSGANTPSVQMTSGIPSAAIASKQLLIGSGNLQSRPTALRTAAVVRDVFNNNAVLQLHLPGDDAETEFCNSATAAFLRSQSLDNDGCYQQHHLIPYQTHRNYYRRYRGINLDQEKRLKTIKQDSLASDSSTPGSYSVRPDGGKTFVGVGGGGGGGGGGMGNQPNQRSRQQNSTRTSLETKREDSFDSLLSSSETEKSVVCRRNRYAGSDTDRKDSLDSLGSIVKTPCSPPPLQTTGGRGQSQPKRSINCMMADIVGLVRRLKGMRFSHETHV